jgi:hypothetical protein
METGDDSNGFCPNKLGQNYLESSDSSKISIIKNSSTDKYTYISSELTGAYNTYREDIENFEKVFRNLL